MKKEYIITRQGKDFALYEGLLDEAHQQGLKRIATRIVQLPVDDNGNVAVVTAEVETAKGIFAGIGDASPANVNRMIVPHLLRMAETRAKARALRDAVNVGVVAVEELGDFDGVEPSEGEQAAPSEAASNVRSMPADRSDERTQALVAMGKAIRALMETSGQSREDVLRSCCDKLGIAVGGEHSTEQIIAIATEADLQGQLLTGANPEGAAS